MKNLTSFCIVLLCSMAVISQQASKPPDVVAGIPVNYDESKVGTYTLPDLFALSNGKRVTDSKTWLTKRRPEIVKLFEQIQFGRMPPRPRDLEFDVFDKGTPAFNGKAVRKQVTVYFTKDHTHKMDLLIYLPAKLKKAPLLLGISFAAPNQIVDEPGVRVGEVWDATTNLQKAIARHHLAKSTSSNSLMPASALRRSTTATSSLILWTASSTGSAAFTSSLDRPRSRMTDGGRSRHGRGD